MHLLSAHKLYSQFGMKKSGIDESLNLLKELQYKLKSGQKAPSVKAPSAQQEILRPTASKKQWGENLVSAYQQQSEGLQEQNRKLKKYVNKLLKMNDYLKNQLIKQDNYQAKEPAHNQSEIELLKMEIEYLREVNRQKDLELQLQLKQKKHERIKSQYTTQQNQQRYSSKCLPDKKMFTKTTIRKQSETDATLRKSMQKRKLSKCPFCYC